ncbi:hypothetical protein FHS95_003186 [Sphingomonas naasensis]|uniref:Alginate lyase n=1 Tax=Sphingomonas naasensis TaxID=1344951 RepID=A0A4V3QW86_9SPHN|nr:alginate lyase family protein [Sphingomonas naasensis]NIJ21483.1 hypothetical protein [Sphingomonas naasensis]TGX41562.1 alginate lyase [Sphingomonas naasensis]
MKSLFIGSLLLLATPAAAQDFAVFDAASLRGEAATPVARGVLARAGAALARPPAPLPRLHTEGTLPGKGIRDISLKAKQDQPIVLDLALAWRLSGDRRYLDQAARYLGAWTGIYRISFNPIDETGFDTLLLATDLVEADLPPKTRATLARFWRRMAEGYLAAAERIPKNQHNNWQSHRIKLATLAAFQLGDPGLIARARAAFRRQIAGNIGPDGTVSDFTERDALHYVTYDLEPLLVAAIAAQRHGEDWYHWKSPSGASLAQAVRWLQPYAGGKQSHVEFVGSRVKFDRDRAAAGQRDYAPHAWKRANAVDTFALAALLDPGLRGFADSLAGETSRRPLAWPVLLAGAAAR